MIAGTLKDTYGCSITIGGATLGLDPKSITPPGIDGGDPIDTSTMSNTLYETSSPQTLVAITNTTITAAYDPGDWDTILAAVNTNQAIIITFADASTFTFWGFLKSFTPNEHTTGADATAECEIVATNTDGSGEEIAPVQA